MSLLPGCWLEVKFKPETLVQKRIETLVHDAVSMRVREVLGNSPMIPGILNRLEDEIEIGSRKRL